MSKNYIKMKAGDESKKVQSAFQKYKDAYNMKPEEYKKKYGDTQSNFKYSVDKTYRNEINKQYDKKASNIKGSEQGEIKYPSTDLRRGDNVTPNTNWMYPHLSGKQQADLTRQANEDIAFELLGLGAEKAIVKVPQAAKVVGDFIDRPKQAYYKHAP